mmetsp:Transcript_6785/g.17325  ORF Transcript_6785/g.17325 Transcript_6785/m.17325 type:complete len:345 (+) Transcript_6785:28-1062(+)
MAVTQLWGCEIHSGETHTYEADQDGDLNLQLTMVSFADAKAKKGETYVVYAAADDGPKFALCVLRPGVTDHAQIDLLIGTGNETVKFSVTGGSAKVHITGYEVLEETYDGFGDDDDSDDDEDDEEFGEVPGGDDDDSDDDDDDDEDMGGGQPSFFNFGGAADDDDSDDDSSEDEAPPPPPPLSPSTKSSETLTRTTSATTAALNDYEAQWIAMATTRKMSVDNAEGLLEAVRGHATKRHEGVVRWYTEKKHYGFIEAPGAAATDLFVHASEVTEPLRAGDKVSFVIGERRGRSAATKVEVLERAPPPPPRAYPAVFGGQQAGFAPYQPYGYAGEVVPESVPVFS